jgi:ADP-heptose:LPS heptosyltransferase
MMQHILFITLSNIGDAVMTTPVLAALRARFPEAQFDIVADARSSALFEHFDALGEIILKHKNASWRDKLAFVRQLRRKRYDLIVDLRTDGLSWLLRARQRLNKNRQRMRKTHSVEQHFHALVPLFGHATPPPTCLWIPEAAHAAAATHLAALPGSRWLALGPGASWDGKIWDAARFAALANQSASEFDGVVLLGGAADRARAEAMRPQLQLPSVDLCGQTGLLEAAAVLARARAFVGNDSGLGHLASAVGTPTLTVFGPGEPLRYRPWGDHARWLVAEEQNLSRLSVEQVVSELKMMVVAP